MATQASTVQTASQTSESWAEKLSLRDDVNTLATTILDKWIAERYETEHSQMSALRTRVTLTDPALRGRGKTILTFTLPVTHSLTDGFAKPLLEELGFKEDEYYLSVSPKYEQVNGMPKPLYEAKATLRPAGIERLENELATRIVAKCGLDYEAARDTVRIPPPEPFMGRG